MFNSCSLIECQDKDVIETQHPLWSVCIYQRSHELILGKQRQNMSAHLNRSLFLSNLHIALAQTIFGGEILIEFVCRNWMYLCYLFVARDLWKSDIGGVYWYLKPKT